MGEEFEERAAQMFPSTVLMISGCQDSQTSADVYNTASFGLPADAGPGGAGGACTSSMIKALNESDGYCWVDLLKRMREILSGTYTQIPMMSTSRQMDLHGPFSVTNPEGGGAMRALLVGINYVGTSSELRGCHNDVHTMKNYLLSQGYEEDNMRILLDDGEHDSPDKCNIVGGMQWLVDGASPGDSLFFHYSGHGASVKDDDGDEKDGKDECLCPVDYSEAGLLKDDEVFQYMVAPLGAGVQLAAVLDCCHSGTILDLPYMWKADDDSLQAVADGQPPAWQENPDFQFGKLLRIIKENPAVCAAAADLLRGDFAGALVDLKGMDMDDAKELGQAMFGAVKKFF